MRTHVLAALIACTLCACAPSTPEPAPAPTQPAKPAETTPASTPAAPAAPAATPAAKEIPEGECGEQSAVPADQRIANTARWATASEQDSFGFDVFRGDAENGPFTKLTKEPVLGAGTSDETHKYEYRDDTIDPCREYWYYIEQTNTDGSKEKISPVFRAAPKRRAVGSAPAASPEAPATPTPAPQG